MGREGRTGMEEYYSDNDWTGMIVDAAIEVHRTLGPGLLESVYEEALAYELQARGLGVIRQVPISVQYKDVRFEMGFRADLLVQGRIIVELKSVEKLAPVHKKQLQTYIRLAHLKVGLLLNFGAALLKEGIIRVVNGADDLPNAGTPECVKHSEPAPR